LKRNHQFWILLNDSLNELIIHPRPKGRGIQHAAGFDLIAASCRDFDP
jgi:hypothetical protein